MEVPKTYLKTPPSEDEIKELVNAANKGFAYEISALLAATNTADYNLLKLGEELAELQEVVMKTYIKSQDRKPKDDKMVEELGDVVFRIMVLSTARGEEFMEAVNERVEEKAQKLLKYYNEGKYIGGI